jgi:agmatine deiminase
MNLIEFDDSVRAELFEGIPSEYDYYFPAEWAKHEACWLSWPHNPDTWPGKIDQIWPAYLEFIKILSLSEKVKINVGSPEMAKDAFSKIKAYGAELEQIFFYLNPTNDAWCRDHGPSFLVNRHLQKSKIIVDWGYNAWGGKYPPYDLDNQIPVRVANQLGLQLAKPEIIMEGGSVEFNGKGAVLTSRACLLNPNRNPELDQAQIEQKLRDFYGIEQVLWVEDGIVGDDTDGHIDDTVRFVNENTVITMVEADKHDVNREPLLVNQRLLEEMTINESRLTVIPIQMPEPLYYDGQRLPASYANFYISNEHVIVPVFNSKNDDQALSILRDCFPGRKVIGVDSTHLVWGLGSFHCLSQQEPG